MTVRDVEGEKLGKVADISGDRFIIEKGLLFKEDFEAQLDHIVEVHEDEVIYSRAGAIAPEAKPEATGAEAAGTAATEELRVPIVEEELEIEKQAHQRGAVRVSKEVITEQKQVTVPVTREEVIVERVPASGDLSAESAGAFVETEIAVPAIEEEVIVSKRPVVREEVRVRKQQVQEQRAVSADVRREEAHVEDLQEERRDRPTDATTEPGMRAPSRDDDIER